MSELWDSLELGLRLGAFLAGSIISFVAVFAVVYGVFILGVGLWLFIEEKISRK